MSADHDQRVSFFRQSGWLMIATVIGGSLMWAVHFLAKAIPEREYGDFGAFLAVVMILPAIPIQMVFAQQTARAIAQDRPAEISTLIRASFFWTFLLCLVVSAVALVFQDAILAKWKISSPAGLWFTLPVVYFSLVLPMIWGVLQGAQNFLWLGWSLMLNSLGRLMASSFAVLVVGTYAAGMLFGVLSGLLLGLSIALLQTRKFWLIPRAPFAWSKLSKQVVPLLLGFIGFQVLFTVDTMFVKAYFPQNEAGYYVSAGTLARALMWLVLPLAAVMFPKLMSSAVKSEKSNLSSIVMAGTAILASVGALCLALLGPILIRLVYRESYVQVATSLLPWYGLVMIPLAVGNVMLNELLAKPAPKLAVGVSLLLLGAAYMVALTQFHGSLITVLHTMGVFNLAFLAICTWFTLQDRRAANRAT
jgi:O-antigen/teichoic acid export membrane protein